MLPLALKIECLFYHLWYFRLDYLEDYDIL